MKIRWHRFGLDFRFLAKFSFLFDFYSSALTHKQIDIIEKYHKIRKITILFLFTRNVKIIIFHNGNENIVCGGKNEALRKLTILIFSHLVE